MTRICFYCKLEKDINEFVRAPRRKDGKGYFCTACMELMRQTLTESEINLLKTNAWRHNNKQSYREVTREVNLKQTLKKFGLTVDDYRAQLIKQNNICPICELPFDDNNNKPIIEHCHTTGLFRGLVHQKCNLLIAAIENHPNYIRNIETYIERIGVYVYLQ